MTSLRPSTRHVIPCAYDLDVADSAENGGLSEEYTRLLDCLRAAGLIAISYCGNRAIDWDEECDGGMFCDGCKCRLGHLPYVLPRLYCRGCGNDQIDAGEECDNGSLCTHQLHVSDLFAALQPLLCAASELFALPLVLAALCCSNGQGTTGMEGSREVTATFPDIG
eukprot:m51a1_g13451 putative serine-threonine protein (166) ;mRNA; f:1427-1993